MIPSNEALNVNSSQAIAPTLVKNPDGFAADRHPESSELVIKPRPGWIPIDWKELFEYRELLWNLTMRDVTVRYKQTVLGSAWAVVQPVTTMLIFTLVFGTVAKLPSDGFPYPVFVFAGLIPWTMFSQGFAKATSSLKSEEWLLAKVYLPRLYIPAAKVTVFLVDLVISLGIYALILLIYRVMPSWTIIFLPVLIALTYIATLALGILFSAWTIFYHDFEIFVPYLTQFIMFLTPVAYPLSMIKSPTARHVLALNPMFGLVAGYRSLILGVDWDFVTFAISSVSGIALFVFAVYYFRRVERHFVDVV